MKFWIKILIAFSVIIVLGFGIWAFFFREKDEVASYNKVSEFIDYKESMNMTQKLNDLKKTNYINKDENKIVITDDTETKKNILNIREITLSSNLIAYYDAGGNQTCEYDSYLVDLKYSDEMINYLLPYLKLINPKDSYIRDIKRSVNDYSSALRDLKDALVFVNECQSTITGTDVEYEVLYGKYKTYHNRYRDVLNASATLIQSMLNAIKNDVGELKCDINFALIDSFSRMLLVSSSVEDKIEPMYAYDLHYIIKKINAKNQGVNIFDDKYTEYDFLTSYNSLINNYPDVLDKVFAKHNLEKRKIANGQNLSDIKQDAQTSIITVLNILGFAKEGL